MESNMVKPIIINKHRVIECQNCRCKDVTIYLVKKHNADKTLNMETELNEVYSIVKGNKKENYKDSLVSDNQYLQIVISCNVCNYTLVNNIESIKTEKGN